MDNYTEIFTRKDGKQVRVTATACYGSGLSRSIDVMVHRRDMPATDWKLCSPVPAPGWKEMCREEYETQGRAESLRFATHSEILSVIAKVVEG